ncbi:MBL fold metallo-hydrolase [Actinomadura viridis]|uniref:Glyoxylase-like metal-dependent hydrolase (Beta-lactamase superfamily II) n=1 Tax=Actinomadura viridis TaxID=58110 RepID=A0A931GIK8_9ACTN|nr:MBL fold metallo-hydrolase [Actinomadura viridis]MBG6088698.1 glyoxylase-like metal-dependent hydrolase (beta-lactamase superfamily II) [Actinomadura viridis]
MSIPVSDRHAAAYRSREVPAPLLVTDGVWAVPVPLHGSPLRFITVFLVETSGGLVLIDAGYDHRSCWESFTGSVAGIGHDLGDVRLVLLTHNHPDHVGLAGRVRAASGARVVMGREDDFAHQHRVRGGFLAQLRRALERTGAPPGVVDDMHAAGAGAARLTEDLRVDLAPEGDSEHVLGDVTFLGLHTPGHTYGHTVYVDTSRGVVFTGDTMMAEGPTQLAVPSLPGDDPAGDLLASLDRLRALDVEIACPAHQFPYRDVAARAGELAAFHRAELDAVERLLRTRRSAWEIAPHLTWARPWEELGAGSRRFALMHTLSLVLGVTR